MKNKFILFLPVVLALFFISCSGLSIQNQQSAAYFAGKGMGAGINEFVPTLDGSLGVAWTGLMRRNQGLEVVPADEIILFYNECLSAIAKQVGDPAGLLGDLAVLTAIYGGQFAKDGKLIAIQPIEMSTLKYFELGYKSGKGAVLRSVLKFPETPRL